MTTARVAPARIPVRRRPEFHVVLGPGTRRRGRVRYWVLLTVALTAAFLLLVYSRIALDRSFNDPAEMPVHLGRHRTAGDHQPLAGEPLQGLADRGTAHADLLAQFGLGYRRSRGLECIHRQRKCCDRCSRLGQ